MREEKLLARGVAAGIMTSCWVTGAVRADAAPAHDRLLSNRGGTLISGATRSWR